MVAIAIRSKYRSTFNYKNQKASSNLSGKNNKKKGNSSARKVKRVELTGRKVLLINMSGVDNFCPVTGQKLATNGMVVEHNGRYYANFAASARASN